MAAYVMGALGGLGNWVLGRGAQPLPAAANPQQLVAAPRGAAVVAKDAIQLIAGLGIMYSGWQKGAGAILAFNAGRRLLNTINPGRIPTPADMIAGLAKYALPGFTHFFDHHKDHIWISMISGLATWGGAKLIGEELIQTYLKSHPVAITLLGAATGFIYTAISKAAEGSGHSNKAPAPLNVQGAIHVPQGNILSQHLNIPITFDDGSQSWTILDAYTTQKTAWLAAGKNSTECMRELATHAFQANREILPENINDLQSTQYNEIPGLGNLLVQCARAAGRQ